jgi:hypothetical protein
MTAALKARMQRMLAWLCRHADAHVRGWCPCPVCDDGERAARTACQMPQRHPERITRELPAAHEEWLAALADELWPADEYTAIIDQPGGEDSS